ncbi:replication initiation protein [Ekhidna sp.]
MTEEQLQIEIPQSPVRVDLDSDSIVRLQNSLLNGNYRFNVHQWRTFLGFLACLYENDYEMRYYNLSIKQLYDLSGKDHKDALKLLRKDAKGLMRHVVEVKQDDGSFALFNLFYGANYIGGQGVLQLAPHPELLEFYKELKNKFTDAYLHEVLKLSTSNTIKIYLILKQFEDTGWRKISFDDFRKQLGLKPGQYKRPIDLERRFIHKAQEELEKTDMAFTYTKYGTPARGFHFVLNEKKEFKKYVPITDEDKRAYEMLEQCGMTEEQINTVMSSISPQEVFKANYQRQLAKSDGQIQKNDAAWITNYLKIEYGVKFKGYSKPKKKKVTKSPRLEKDI